MQNKKILILGVGNILLHDEGVGVKAVAKLDSEYDFSDNVQLFDGGTLGLRLLDPISEADHLIVVDCVKYGHPPGTLYRFSIEDFERRGNFRNSLHQLDLVETLAFAEIIGGRGYRAGEYLSLGHGVDRRGPGPPVRYVCSGAGRSHRGGR
jgi:hydrogenase maturation protease